jgi:hypothetical protein
MSPYKFCQRMLYLTKVLRLTLNLQKKHYQFIPKLWIRPMKLQSRG